VIWGVAVQGVAHADGVLCSANVPRFEQQQCPNTRPPNRTH
jgi:hypothetical protein